jgi:hypothetical protein
MCEQWLLKKQPATRGLCQQSLFFLVVLLYVLLPARAPPPSVPLVHQQLHKQ